MSIIQNIFKKIIFFPFWWYSKGFFNLGKKIMNFMINREKSLAIFIWMKNLFKPMYGQYDWQGMLISFFMRLFQIVFRSVILLFYLIICLAILVSWLLFPVYAVYQVYFQLL